MTNKKREQNGLSRKVLSFFIFAHDTIGHHIILTVPIICQVRACKGGGICRGVAHVNGRACGHGLADLPPRLRLKRNRGQAITGGKGTTPQHLQGGGQHNLGKGGI